MAFSAILIPTVAELISAVVNVHRNTLVYRLEKLEKSTGLDIRKFDDALTFKIAMMVVSYMTYMNNSENL